MNLFIDTISKNACLILFNENKDIIKEKQFLIKGNESSLLVTKIDNFLKENGVNYFDLLNIILVNGPGSFTGVRTSVLAINTINYITKKSLTPISFFDLFGKYPIIKTSSKRDSFFKKDKDSKIEIIENTKIEDYLKENKINKIYGDLILENIETIEKVDYNDIIKKIEYQNLRLIDPLYIKKPNIC